MIYFDNAATTKYKPEQVYNAMNFYLKEIGVSPGRGSYNLGIQASRMLYQSRCAVGRYFGMSNPERVIFTKNSTEAINLLLNGLLKKGDHVIISCYEHNAVLRPICKLAEMGIIEYSVILREDLGLTAEELFKKYARRNTRLFALTLASNLTGRIIFNKEWTTYFHEEGVITLVDSSQGAGILDINMSKEGIDFLAFTGHKDLLGLPGTGGLCCESPIHFNPLIQGGTGIHGEFYVNPDIFPEGFESGTLNMPAIWALKAGIEYLNENKKEIQEHENRLINKLIQGLEGLSNITVYDLNVSRVPTCCINIKGVSSDRVVAILDEEGICSRGGIHCAILAHEALGTVSTGAVRLSLGFYNTEREVDAVIKVLSEVGE